MTVNITSHHEHDLMIEEVAKNRKCVSGSFFVKRDKNLLPHPSQIDTHSDYQVMRYSQYLAGAEFPEYPKSTLASLLGKMAIDKTKIDLPAGVKYLEQDVDGDGLSMKGLLQSCVSNTFQVGFHLLIADYKGLTSIDLDQTSVADGENLKEKPRATISQYPRESIKDWYFSKVNGKMQLVYLLLEESGVTLDIETFQKKKVISYLRLYLTEDGYFQQKITQSESGGFEEGEPMQLSIGKKDKEKQLDFIPYSIASDKEVPVGVMPIETGFLTPIIDLALYRYRVSADYKESLSSLQPMVNISGLDAHGWEEFKKTNGRDYIATGAKTPNIFSDSETVVNLSETSLSLEQYEKFFERNDKDARARGAINNTENATQRTVIEIMTESSAGNAVLNPIANSSEDAVKQVSLYCAMFEGLYSEEDLSSNMEQMIVKMPREFAISKLLPEEVKTLLEVYESALLSKEEFWRLLDQGGWTVSELDKIKLEIGEASTDLNEE